MSTKNTFLTDSRRDFFASSLVIISAFILVLNIAFIEAFFHPIVIGTNLVYALGLWGYISLFTGKSRSEILKRLMTLYSIIGIVISFSLAWGLLSFGFGFSF